jgi:hypothetical protein
VSPAATAERDSDGLPWDERIHSETHKKNADNTWRYRRNLDPVVKATVYAELKAAYGQQVSLPQQPPAVVTSGVPVPPAPSTVPVAPVAAAPVPVPPVPAAGVVPAVPSNVVSLHPAVPVPTAPALGVPDAPQPGVVPAAPVTNFRQLFDKVTKATAAGKITLAQVDEACKAVGLDSITALAAQPMKVPEVDNYLNRWIAA